MMLKTLVILLSLSIAYSSATSAMDQDDSSMCLRNIRHEQAKIEKEIEQASQKFHADQAKRKEAVDQMHNQCVLADQKLIDESSELLDASENGTLSTEEMSRKFEDQRQRTIAEKKPLKRNVRKL